MSEKSTAMAARARQQTKAIKKRNPQRAARAATKTARKATRDALTALLRVEWEKQRGLNRATRRLNDAFERMVSAVHELAECLPEEFPFPSNRKKWEHNFQRTERKGGKAHRLIGAWLDAQMERRQKRWERDLAQAAVRSLGREIQPRRRRRKHNARSVCTSQRKGGTNA